MKKMKIDNNLYDVISPSEYHSNPSIYERGQVAVQFNNCVVPYRGTGGMAPGFYATPIASYAILSEDQKYNSSNILDFDSCKDVISLMEMNQNLKSLENEIIASSDNIYAPKITADDTPEMAGLRQAIIEKQTDIDLYQDRFGASFNNDKRILNNSPSITFTKLKSVATNLDMKATLIIEDMDENVPAPIGRQIVIPLNYVNEEDN